jgi:hypothetical protein
MLGVVKVLSRVLVFRRITTANVAALQAHAQMHPGIPGFDAIFAHTLVGFRKLHPIEMSAFSGHTAAPVTRIC